MHTYSVSAPTISAEAERKEFQELSPAERQEIENDLYGRCLPILERTDMVAQAEQDLRAEIDVMSMNGGKEAYLEALQQCPELVQRESAPIKFLRCERFHAKNAARRLVRYWEMRRRLFGPKKAYLPMTLNGALQDDRAMAETGVFQVLPCDDKGRSVLVYERHAVPDSMYNRDSVLRVFWYCLHVLSEHPSQPNGLVTVANCKQYSVRLFDRKFTLLKWETFRHAAPIRLRAIHACATPHQSTYQLVWPVARFVMGPFYRPRVLLHHGPEQQVLHTLRQFGIDRDRLPHELGGTYTKKQHVEWIQEQDKSEQAELEQSNRMVVG